MWRKSLITPVFKGKGKDPKNPLSYRPISLICNSSKIFTNILNKRLLLYTETNGLLVEEQNSFRKGRSCQDHIFVLSNLIEHKLKLRKSVFACFVDFFSAFDFLNRDLMMHTLKNNGIDGKFLNIIRQIYKNTQYSIRINDKYTDWFQTKSGVKQGQNDSPTIFAIFLNSLVQETNLTNKGVKIGNVCINILLYADDLVLLSETEEDLQCMLNILDKWCRKWRMVINMEKTQIIHFRYKQKPQTSFIFYLGSQPISIVT